MSRNTDGASEPLDPHNMSLIADDGSEMEAELVAAGEIPDELSDEFPDRSDEPKTGLVSDFRDLSFGQSAFLVSNRETTTVSRSPLFYLTTLIAGLIVLAGLVYGFAQAKPADGSSTGGTLATVGLGEEQAQAASQQLGLEVTDVDSAEAAEELLRSGQADAAYIPDMTGQGQAQIIALDKEPTAILDAMQQAPEVTYLEPAPVDFAVAQPVAIGLAGLVIAAALTLGFALFANLRVEKRNHIAEVIAATIPARASAWGRVQGLSVLSLMHLVIVAVLLLVGLSIGSYTSLAVSMLPALGWYALLYLLTVFTVLGLFLWSASLAGRRNRQALTAAASVITVAGAFAPLFFTNSRTVLQYMAYAPFTSPTAAVLRFFNGQAQWWEGLIGVGVALAVGLIIFALAAGAYQANLLKGAGRGGRKARVKKGRGKADSTGDEKSEKKSGKASAADDDAESDDAEAPSEDEDADAADPVDDDEGLADDDADFSAEDAAEAAEGSGDDVDSAAEVDGESDDDSAKS